MIVEGLRDLLLDQSSITALCPSQPANRVNTPTIFCDAPSQGVSPPFIVITDISTDPMPCLDGHYGLRSAEIDIDCYAVSATAARTLSITVRDFLRDYDGTAGDTEIKAVIQTDEADGYATPQEGRDVKFYYQTTTYQVQYEES